jgi:hypothetical protein
MTFARGAQTGLRRTASRLAAALALSCALCTCAQEDAPGSATIVSPVYGNGCRFVQCSPHGACAQDPEGAPVCLCDVGYTGERCATCEPDFHLDALDRCVPDKSCPEQAIDPCGEHGHCDDSQRVIACQCDEGYEGPRCKLCRSGFEPDDHEECLQLVLVPDDGQTPTPTQPPIPPPDSPMSPAPGGCDPVDCSGNGRCDNSTGAIVCACHERYAGARCEQCGDEYRRDATNACVPAERCTAEACSGRGSCDDSSGLASCTCEPSFAGERCELCAAGFHPDGLGGCALDEQCMPSSCAGHGSCTLAGGIALCSCDAGYAVPHCERCASAFHRAGELCVPDEVCAEASCNRAGTCDATSGTIRCICDQRYWGERCQNCAPGLHYRDPISGECREIGCADRPSPPVSFEGMIGFPASQDTCQTGVPFNTVALTMTSSAGHGPLWACGPSRAYGLETKHVLLEAGVSDAAQLIFGDGIVELRFDYAAPNALALEVRADGVPMAQAISAAQRTIGNARYTFPVPIKVLELRSLGPATVLVALDNIDYEYATCQ